MTLIDGRIKALLLIGTAVSSLTHSRLTFAQGAEAVAAIPQGPQGADAQQATDGGATTASPEGQGLGGAPVVAANPPMKPSGFLRRLFKAYEDDWRETPSSGPEPEFRGYPAPEANPPYPFTVWPYGGSPVIGQPDTNVPPLMQALYGGSSGKAWESSRVKIYGWVNYGGNLSTSSQSHGLYANLPTAYSEIPNTVQL